jgi:hypothetical protein
MGCAECDPDCDERRESESEADNLSHCAESSHHLVRGLSQPSLAGGARWSPAAPGGIMAVVVRTHTS